MKLNLKHQSKLILANAAAVTTVLAIGYILTNNIQMPAISAVQEIVTQFRDISNSSRTTSTIIVIFLAAIAYSLPLPLTAFISLSIGAMYGYITGFGISLLSSILAAAFLFYAGKLGNRSGLRSRYKKQIQKFSDAIEDEKIYSLVSIRWIPGIPFFILNLALGFANVKFRRFVVSSILGISVPTLLLVYAGSKLSEIESFSEILSPSIFLMLFLLGVMPLTLRHLAKILSNND